MWATAGQGSFSQPCQWTSTKPWEKEPMVQEPPLAYASQGLAVVLSPVFTLAHCFTYWLSHLHPVGHYGISQQSETNFPSKLSAAALEPLAHNWKVSNLLPFHCSQCFLQGGWTFPYEPGTRLEVPAQNKLTIITQPTSFICLPHSRQIK